MFEANVICDACQAVNPVAARFCSECGTEVRGQRELAQSSPQEEEETQLRSDRSDQDTPIVHAGADHLLGSTIAGKYRIIGKLGAGGMGAVYRATRLVIGDEVAVKILHSEQNDPKAGERFRREAQAAARLKHQNAVSIYDFGVTDDGLQYLVMELVEGESLRRIIKQQGPLTPSASAQIISQVCAALDEAHAHHIIHRDIKPDNIIVNLAGNRLRVKVLDFGIAKLRDDTAGNLTQTGSILGTPHYMSPEQCLGEELDSRSDIYSLGIVLYEMLTGVVPFNSPISTAVVVQHVNQPPPSLRALNASITMPVEIAVLHALAKPRQARPETAGALALELTAAMTSPNLVGPVEANDSLSRDASVPTIVVSGVSRAAIQGSARDLTGERLLTRQSNLTKTIGVTVVVTLFLLGLGGLGFRMLFSARGESENGTAGNSNLLSQATPSINQLTGRMQSTPEMQVSTSPSDSAPVNTSLLSNITIDFDQTGTQATATFDKAFAFVGEKHFSGSVRTRLWLTKIGSRWLITAERDLKVHYINK